MDWRGGGLGGSLGGSLGGGVWGEVWGRGVGYLGESGGVWGSLRASGGGSLEDSGLIGRRWKWRTGSGVGRRDRRNGGPRHAACRVPLQGYEVPWWGSAGGLGCVVPPVHWRTRCWWGRSGVVGWLAGLAAEYEMVKDMVFATGPGLIPRVPTLLV